ncbi:MAG TPA: hypothetical protein VF892_17220 [Pseudonocardiaceae bacterium]
MLSACGTAVPTTAPPVLTTTDSTLFVSYFVDAEVTLAKLKSSLIMGRGRFDAHVDLVTGTITGTLTLPPSRGTFLSFGFVPVGATTRLTEDGSVTGTFSAGIADVTAHEFVGLGAATVNGTALDVGSSCQTAQPAVIRIRGPLNLLGTSHFTSTFTVPGFAGCGATENLDPLFDGLVAGPNNVLATTLTFRCSADSCPPDS